VSQRPEDVHELTPAIERIEENLGTAPRQGVADGGYTHWGHIVAMDTAGIDFIGSLTDQNRVAGQCAQRGVGDAFRPDHFVYDEQSDTYTCPEGKRLSYNGQDKRVGQTHYIYRARKKECKVCPHKG